ncbi:hypothetical protein HPB50_008902 [Hyalomma asiaticum]|uniref:Uncharacterized protein n=1 Tax=Hyalomma asiaticum TaxID=266040 RepID=A0ACB7RXU8_HYAAI|nr:hypothetical protein HPB50_008902 [Hyalomma asiaticum]
MAGNVTKTPPARLVGLQSTKPRLKNAASREVDMTARETAPPCPRGHTAGTHPAARKNRRRETPSRSGQSSGPAELENTKKLGEDALHSAPSSHTSKLAPQHGGASQQCGREDEQHGDRNGCAARKLARREGKPAPHGREPAETAVRNLRKHLHLKNKNLASSSSTSTPPRPPPPRRRQPRLAMVSRNRDTDKVRSGNCTETLGPSGSGTDKRPQRTTKVARRDFPGRLRGRTPSSGREEATATQRPSQGDGGG